MQPLGPIVDFLFEAGMLAKTPRSGFFFLGSGKQSVAEHTNRVAYVGFALSKLANADTAKVVQMILFHDFSEARISDLNYVHQKYTVRKEDEATKDLIGRLPFGSDIGALVDEYHERASLEAKIAKDADNIEWLLALKEQMDIGNVRAKTWFPSAMKRMLTEQGKQLATEILFTDSDRWWFEEKDSEWWVTRNQS